MEIVMTKKDLENIIFKITGVYPDHLKLLDVISPFCDQQDIKNAKILFLVGCNKEYFITGVSFDDRQDVIKDICPHDIITFVPEPDNPHDPYAIQAFFRDKSIGYLPRKQAALLQDCIEDLCGEIVAIKCSDHDEDLNLGLRFVFRRKENINKKQVLNMDKIELALQGYAGTQKETIALAQMQEILDEINKNKTILLSDPVATELNDNKVTQETTAPAQKPEDTEEDVFTISTKKTAP